MLKWNKIKTVPLFTRSRQLLQFHPTPLRNLAQPVFKQFGVVKQFGVRLRNVCKLLNFIADDIFFCVF
jgi:hypothetical protein